MEARYTVPHRVRSEILGWLLDASDCLRGAHGRDHLRALAAVLAYYPGRLPADVRETAIVEYLAHLALSGAPRPPVKADLRATRSRQLARTG